MTNKPDKRMEVLYLSMIIVFAALSTALSLIPAFPIIGFSGVITLGALAGVLIALYLEPRIGFFSVLLVIAATPVVNPGLLSVLGGYTYYLPIIYSWILTTLYYRYKPFYAFILHIIMISLFTVLQRDLITYYPGYLLYDGLLPPIVFILDTLFRNTHLGDKTRLLGAIVYGIVGDHLGGSTAASIYYLYGMGLYEKLIHSQEALNGWITIWKTASYIYPVERTILIIIAVLSFAPSLKAWEKYYNKVLMKRK